MTVELRKKLDSIDSREALAEFINDLRKNLIDSPEEWENATLADFLEALAAWVQDMDGYYVNNKLQVPLSPSWKLVAEIMLAAKYYE
jgi:hypothetical protein